MEPKRLSSTYVTYRGKLTLMLRDSLPLIGLAAISKERVWALIRDEFTEDRWLYEVNLAAKQIIFKVSLDQPFDRIRYSEGILILISEETAAVRAFLVKP